MTHYNIGIIGQGFVGGAVREGFTALSNHTIRTFDIDETKCNSTFEEVVNASDVIFVCLPTPMKTNGECYTGIVEETVQKISNQVPTGERRVLVLKSTMPPGTSERIQSMVPNLDIVFNPEFLTEANAANDFINQNRIVLGFTPQSSWEARNLITTLFVETFTSASTYACTASEAEMVKYVTNNFLTVKVSFANEMYKICQAAGLDYWTVVQIAAKDERLGTSHWRVPGPDGDFGYGGHCFPKDIAAMIKVANDLGVTPTLLEATVQVNDEVRSDLDWTKQEGRAVINL